VDFLSPDVWRRAVRSNDRLLSARLLDAGGVARPLSSLLFHKSREQGLFLGFAAWNEKEIDPPRASMGRIVR
jgi:GntR family transcriptional regulator/MocR family aminotransferase